MNELEAGFLFPLLDVPENGIQIVVEAGGVGVSNPTNLIDDGIRGYPKQRSDIGLERRDFWVCRKLFTGNLLRRNRHTSADVTTTCGIAVFVGVLARCRIVEKIS